jgi:hypothetical protein
MSPLGAGFLAAATPPPDYTDRLRLDVKVSHGNEIGIWSGQPVRLA